MQLTLDQSSLRKLLAILPVTRDGVLSIHRTHEHTTLGFCSANGEVRYRVPGGGDILSIGLDLESTKAILRLRSTSIRLRMAPTQVTVIAGSSKVILPLVNTRGLFVPTKPAALLRMSGPLFATVLSRMIPHASKDKNRPILNSVLIQPRESHLEFVATDGRHMVIRQAPNLDPEKFSLPIILPLTLARAILGALRFAPQAQVSLLVGDKRELIVRLTEDEATLEISPIQGLLAGNYPNYQAIVESIEQGVCCDTQLLRNTLGEFSKKDNVRILVSPSGLVLESVSGGRQYSRAFPWRTTHHRQITVACGLLSGLLSRANSPWVDLGWGKNMGALYLVSPNETCILMPMRSPA